MTHLHIYAYSWYLRVIECQRCLEELEFHLLIMNIYEKLGMASLLWCVCISDQAITFGQNIGKICPLNPRQSFFLQFTFKKSRSQKKHTHIDS